MDDFEKLQGDRFNLHTLIGYLNDLSGQSIRHNDAKRRILDMHLNGHKHGHSFKRVKEITIIVRGRSVVTYELTREQVIVIATQVSPSFLLKVIDRLDALERRYEDSTTQNELVEAMKALDDYVNKGIIPEGVKTVECMESINGKPVMKFFFRKDKYINTVFPGSTKGVKVYDTRDR